jgi:hypothetical protein
MLYIDSFYNIDLINHSFMETGKGHVIPVFLHTVMTKVCLINPAMRELDINTAVNTTILPV